MAYGYFNASALTESELIQKLQGTWVCVSEPSRLTLCIKDNSVTVNDESPQKVHLEKFSDGGWTFRLSIRIDGTLLERTWVDRVAVMTFKDGFKSMFLMVMSPPDARTIEDLIIYDCPSMEFKISE